MDEVNPLDDQTEAFPQSFQLVPEAIELTVLEVFAQQTIELRI
jgi:hypothetical protein